MQRVTIDTNVVLAGLDGRTTASLRDSEHLHSVGAIHLAVSSRARPRQGF